MTAGSRTPDAPPLDRTVPYTGHQHEIHRFLEVAALAGAAPVTLEPHLEVTDADRAEPAAALAEDDRQLVVLHPGANDPRRRWPVERLAVVGSELARKGARLAVVGTAAEQPLADRLLDRLNGDAVDLTGRLGLGGLAGLLEQATLLVGNDSGPRHLATAVGTATVAVHWGVNLQASFVADVTVDEVLTEALDLLATETASASDNHAPALDRFARRGDLPQFWPQAAQPGPTSSLASEVMRSTTAVPPEQGARRSSE